MINNRQHFYWSSIILVFLAGSAGCVKSTANYTPPAVAYLTLMNLAPYGSPVDIYLSGTLVTASGGIPPGEFSTQYGQLKPGTYTVDFKVSGTDSLLSEIPAAQYDTSNFYTLVIYNTTPGSAAVQGARIQDNLSQISASNSYYRFFNMSPDAASVNLVMNGSPVQTNRTPADNINNQTFDQFLPISPGTYTIQAENSGSDSVLGTQSKYPFAAAYVYTIFLTGTSKAGMTLTVLPVVF